MFIELGEYKSEYKKFRKKMINSNYIIIMEESDTPVGSTRLILEDKVIVVKETIQDLMKILQPKPYTIPKFAPTKENE